MDAAELTSLLPVFRLGPLSAEATAALAAMCSCRAFAAGEVIFEEGAVAPWVYWVIEGRVGLEMCVPARGCTRILTLERGDFLAWSAQLGDGRMTASAIALAPTQLLAAQAADVQRLCDADHDFGYRWMQALAVAMLKRLTATRLQLLDLYQDAR